MRAKLVCLLLVSSLLAASCSRGDRASLPSPAPQAGGGGSEVGPGGDNVRPGTGAAWFAQSNRKIKYCYRRAPDFTLGESALRPVIEAAFAVWDEYVRRKQITFGAKGELQLSTEPEFYGACDGKEDLRFDFGVSSPEIDRAREHYVNPSAFPERLRFFPSTTGAWAQGFLWIAKRRLLDEKSAYSAWGRKSLTILVAHELGHTLGVGHVPGTIMSEEISTDLLFWEKKEPVAVDRDRELAVGPNAVLRYHGPFDRSLSPGHQHDWFHRFTGRDPVGKIEVSLFRRGYLSFGPLVLSDEKGVTVLPDFHEDPGQISPFWWGESAFKLAFLEQGRVVARQVQTFALSEHVKVTPVEGEPIALYLQYNANDLLQGTPLELFSIGPEGRAPLAAFSARTAEAYRGKR